MKPALLALVLSACTNLDPGLEPDVGAPQHAACANLDHDPAHDVSFSAQIEGVVLEPYHCRNCHSPTGTTPIGFLVGGLDLSSYDGLRAGGVRSGAGVVVPGIPCDSVLLQKLREGPPFGSRMPLDGPPYLDNADLELVSDWILEGAHDN